MVAANACGLPTVFVSLAALFGDTAQTMRQRLREWAQERSAKQGAQGVALDVTTCCAPLGQGVLSGWADEEPRFALALEAATGGPRLTVFAVCIVDCGGGVGGGVCKASVFNATKSS